MNKLIVLIILSISLTGCAFEGKIYVAIHWDETNPPIAITHDMNSLPAYGGGLVNGGYYQILPNTYSITVTYGVDWDLNNFTLSTKQTILGIEDNYYDIVCFSNRTPICQTVPTF